MAGCELRWKKKRKARVLLRISDCEGIVRKKGGEARDIGTRDE
jgi:hypothetical protein